MKILITGSSGFIGSHLSPLLSGQHEIYHLSNDLRNHAAVRFEVREKQPDIIVHLGARTEVEQSFYEQITFSEINYVGTVNLIEISREIPNFKNFVFASTMEVYGQQPEGTVCDHLTTPYPNAPYAVAKYGCEKYLEYAGRSYNLPYTIIRQTNCYGRKDNDFFVTEQIISQMIKNPEEINLGYAEPYRNFIYIDDMLEAWTKIINNPEKCNHKIFTLGPDEPIKIRDYVNIIAQKLQWQGEINWDTKPHRPGEIYWLNSSGKLLEDTLGWKPKVSLSDGLDRTIAWWRNVAKR
tara:strand:- start:5969 stop:6850 length:882 start_codon:yes stop_codon:yes gene_type:complete